MAPPPLSKHALGEVTNSSSSSQNHQIVHHRSAKRAASSRRNTLARPPRARKSLVPSAVKQPLSKSSCSGVKLQKASIASATTASSSDTDDDAQDRDSQQEALAAMMLVTVVKNETVVEESSLPSPQKQQQATMQQQQQQQQQQLLLQEENLHLKIDKFHLLKELHYAYSMFVSTGYRCTHLEAENKQLRQDQERLRHELSCLATFQTNINTKINTTHDDDDASSSHGNDVNNERNE